MSKSEYHLPKEWKHKRQLLRESNPLVRRQLQEWNNDDAIERQERAKAFRKQKEL